MEVDNEEGPSGSVNMEVDEVEDGIQWRFSQIKGNLDNEDSPTDADLISCVEFSPDGEFLATGDKGGRVVIFQRDQSGKYTNGARSSEYNVYSTFQSHEPEFDYLKSLEIEEKINQIRFLKKKNASNFIISTNDKTVKLWKISERERRMAEGNFNLRNDDGTPRQFNNSLVLPKLEQMELIVEASPRRVYANAHTYHINSISVNSDQETFISSDDLRVNLWHHEITSQSYNIVDIKPTNMEELTEVITAAEFHPKDCNLLAYSSSKGIIRLCDMRVSALCDGNPIIFFEEKEDANNRSFFSEIISSVSDVKFSHNGQFILTRDYLTVNVWDIRQDAHPLETYNVHEYLRSKLCVLYENDSIFDKFECCWSGDDKHIVTGSYSNLFRTFQRGVSEGATYEASVDAYDSTNSVLRQRSIPPAPGARRRRDDNSENLDYTKKILHVSWHPSSNIIALAATNNLYIFEGHNQRNALS